MSNSCYSCGMPLVAVEVRGNYCQYCADDQGNLHPRELIQQGIAQWLEGWAPEEEGPRPDFMERANSYMKAMPAWAE